MCLNSFAYGFIVSVAYLAVAESNSGALKAISCFEEMGEENNITYLLLNTRTQQQMDEFCKRIGDSMKCISDNEHHLTTAQNTEYLKMTSGIYQFYINLCPPGSDITEDYRENAECFSVVQRQLIYCDAYLPSMGSPSMKEPEDRCCILKLFRECVVEAVKLRCGEVASNMSGQMVERYHKTFMNECDNVHLIPCDTLISTHRTKSSEHDSGGGRNDLADRDQKTSSTGSPDLGWTENVGKEKTTASSNSVTLQSAFITLCYVILSVCLFRVHLRV